VKRGNMKKVEVSLAVRMFVLWLGLSLALFGLDLLGIFGGVRGMVEAVLVPVEQTVYGVSRALRSPIQTVRFWRTGVARIADLERQVAELTVDSARLASLEEENTAMRKLLDAPLPAKWSFIPASVVGRGEEISIGVGVREGVSTEDVVVWGDVILGIVSEVSQRQSKMRLLNDPESKIPVYLPSSGADGLLQGKFGSQMMLTQVLQSVKLYEDESVVTSGAFGPPRGLVVGRLSEVVSDETDVYQEALIEPIVDVSSLQTVFVVKGGGN
jgi:rod shape-determining protein MreC